MEKMENIKKDLKNVKEEDIELKEGTKELNGTKIIYGPDNKAKRIIFADGIRGEYLENTKILQFWTTENYLLGSSELGSLSAYFETENQTFTQPMINDLLTIRTLKIPSHQIKIEHVENDYRILLQDLESQKNRYVRSLGLIPTEEQEAIRIEFENLVAKVRKIARKLHTYDTINQALDDYSLCKKAYQELNRKIEREIQKVSEEEKKWIIKDIKDHIETSKEYFHIQLKVLTTKQSLNANQLEQNKLEEFIQKVKDLLASYDKLQTLVDENQTLDQILNLNREIERKSNEISQEIEEYQENEKLQGSSKKLSEEEKTSIKNKIESGKEQMNKQFVDLFANLFVRYQQNSNPSVIIGLRSLNAKRKCILELFSNLSTALDADLPVEKIQRIEDEISVKYDEMNRKTAKVEKEISISEVCTNLRDFQAVYPNVRKACNKNSRLRILTGNILTYQLISNTLFAKYSKNANADITEELTVLKKLENELFHFAKVLNYEGLKRKGSKQQGNWHDRLCLEACTNLYSKNIRTISGTVNLDIVNLPGTARIVIEYDTLSEENKKIAQELIKQNVIGPLYRYPGHDELVFDLVIPISSMNDVENTSERLNKIASLFGEQDVLYGNKTIKQAQEFYKESYKLDMSIEEVIHTEIALGKSYDESEQRLWENEELRQKHIQFMKQYNRKKSIKADLL